jgi:hypothetical protein
MTRGRDDLLSPDRSSTPFADGWHCRVEFGTTNGAVPRTYGGRPMFAGSETLVGTPQSCAPSILHIDQQRSESRLNRSACRFDNTGAFSQRYTRENMIALIVEHLLNVCQRTSCGFATRTCKAHQLSLGSGRASSATCSIDQRDRRDLAARMMAARRIRRPRDDAGNHRRDAADVAGRRRRSASRRNVPATTTRSPAARPSTICTRPPNRQPVST